MHRQPRPKNLAPEWLQREKGPWIQLLEPHSVEWNRIRLPIPGLAPDLVGLRILHVSDFHMRAHWYPSLDPLLERIAQSKPDLLMMTGDFGENRHNYRPSLPYVLRLIEGLRGRLGSFAIIGNHDQHGLIPHIEKTHMAFMENRRQVIQVGEGKVEVIGIPGHHRNEFDPEFVASIPTRDANSVRIILSHHPDHIRKTKSLNADLFLTGHTHGGQVCLPNGFPFICHDKLPKALSKGIHRFNNTWLVVNKGYGFSGPPIRLFCPSEVIEIELGEVSGQ